MKRPGTAPPRSFFWLPRYGRDELVPGETMPPVVIIQGYSQAREDKAILLKDTTATKIDLEDTSTVRKVIQSGANTMIIAKWSNLGSDIASNAVKTTTITSGDKKEIDLKQYAKVEKVGDKSLRCCAHKDTNIIQYIENYKFENHKLIR